MFSTTIQDGGLAQLEQRQEAILDKLKSLQMKLDTIHPPEQVLKNPDLRLSRNRFI